MKGRLALVLLVAAYAAPALLLGEAYFYRDLSRHFLPQKTLAAEQIRQGHAPLWDPNRHAGAPLMGDPNNVVPYPTTALYLMLSPHRALTIEIVLHLVLAAFGAHALAGALGLGPPARFLAGAAYAFSGIGLSLVNLLNHLIAFAWMPGVLFAWLCWLRGGKLRWFAAAVGAGALQLASGGAETCLITYAGMAGLTLVAAGARAEPVALSARAMVSPSARAMVARCGWLAAAWALIAGVGAVSLLPALEVVRESSRGAALPFDIMTRYSVHPLRLPEMALPNLLGFTDTLAASDYWGLPLEGAFPYVVSIYFGPLVLALALTGALAEGAGPWFPRRLRRLLLACVVLSIVLSLGRHLPGFQLVRFLPFVSSLRYPVKFLLAAALPVALLAGAGLESRPSRLLTGSLAVTAAASAAAGLALWLGTAPSQAVVQAWFGAAGDAARLGVARAFLSASLAPACAAAVMAWRSASPSVRSWLLGGIVALDLASAGRRLNPTAPASFLSREPAVVAPLRASVGRGRLLRVPMPPDVILRAPANDVAYQARWNDDVLTDYIAASHRIPVVYHEDDDLLGPRRIVALGELLRALPWERRRPLLAAACVTVVMTHETLDLPWLQLLATIPNASRHDVHVYAVAGAPEPVRFARRARFVPSAVEAANALLDPDFDPAHDVVIEGAGAPDDAGGGGDATITNLEEGPAFVRCTVDAASEGHLVISRTWYPGWEMRVDGARVPVERADVAFCAARIPRGTHVIELRYRPASLRRGALASAASLLALAALALVRARRLPSPCGAQ